MSEAEDGWSVVAGVEWAAGRERAGVAAVGGRVVMRPLPAGPDGHQHRVPKPNCSWGRGGRGGSLLACPAEHMPC